ncbi:GSCFA domain-containing protein [Algibacter marinivivus]|uniref:GSCFA domain-containing protein n=1 Tax=Algibacter marinivivus TaxID=2100723 RepID=A0A2U2X9S0_9FLAO|nr:GSCFA domain-containing protein [Algibacter marinivivus]PWH84490.1 GSCFA domain-containing protein [Algibacter marinivivus]
MNLQTKIKLEKQSNNQIDFNSNIFLLGSCFSENIGKKLDYFKFQNFQNPFGILFHPKAIDALIKNSIESKQYTEKDVFFHNEQWHCFDIHSKLSCSSKEDLLNKLNSQIELTSTQIKESTHIIITLGTSWVYRDINTDSIVANCHKIPQKQFKKELLSVEAVSNSLKNSLSLIRSMNNNASIIFTVSPVRHLKDGFVENTQSKAHLIAAIHQVVKNQSFYFPSYEIMMDELRDYRFYNEDMIHPNQLAINYIWDIFKTVWVSDKSFNIMDEVDTIQKGLQHKPFNPQSQSYKTFLQNLEAKKRVLQSQFPRIKF